MAESRGKPADVESTLDLLAEGNYIADRSLATALFLSLAMSRPLLLEGEAGVGKTELARVLAAGLGRRLIRLQCYDGLDLAQAAYEWNYPQQLLAIRSRELCNDSSETELYSEAYLLRRPLLDALEPDPAGPPVLLIDELDRADEPFEAFLLEFLADFQISIPELGAISAAQPPIVVVTSNRTREVHDALRRRCLYHWVPYPSADAEARIVALKVPGLGRELAAQVIAFVQSLRAEDLFKPPGTSETIDWAQALLALNARRLDVDTVQSALGALLKYQDDVERLQDGRLERLVESLQPAA